MNGDSGNDAELFEVPGVLGCIVSNAMPELVQWADAHPSERLFRCGAVCGTRAHDIHAILAHLQQLDMPCILRVLRMVSFKPWFLVKAWFLVKPWFLVQPWFLVNLVFRH